MNESGMVLALLRRQVALAGVALVAALIVSVAAANHGPGASAATPVSAGARQPLAGGYASAVAGPSTEPGLAPGSVGRSKLAIVGAIASMAPALGLDPAMELAVALVETGGTLDPGTSGDRSSTDGRAVGGYCSFGLFQLNRCGGQGAEYTAGELVDPATNIAVALSGHAVAVSGGAYPDAATAIVYGFQRPGREMVEEYVAAISPGGSRYVEALTLLARLEV